MPDIDAGTLLYMLALVFVALTIPIWMGLVWTFVDAFRTVWADFMTAMRGK